MSDNPTLQNPSFKNHALMEGAEFVDYDYASKVQPTDSTNAKAFKAAFRAKYGSDPAYFSAGTYDSIMLVAKAVAAVGENPKKVGDYISHLKNYQGVTGMYSFDDDCEVNRDLVFRTIKGGEVQDLVLK